MSKLALRVMRGSGIFSLTRACSAKMARILVYHNFSGQVSNDPNALSVEGVRTQFHYLRRHYKVVPLMQIAEQLASGRALDARMVALTIDDGRRNCYKFLFPMLQEFELPATFFVVSSFIRREDWIWTDKIMWLSEQPKPPDELAGNGLEDFFRLLNRLRPEDRNARITNVAQSVGAPIPRIPPAKYAPSSWSELQEMANSGLVEIGSHTVTHPILSSVTDEESWLELTRSRAQIEEGLGRKVRSFCFPNGMAGDFRPSQVRQVREAGYECSVISQFGMVDGHSDPYQLPRIGAARKSKILEFSKYVDGVVHYQQKLGF